MHSKKIAMNNLKQLRIMLEEYKRIDTDAACWWYDILQSLGFSEAEMQHIMGFSFFIVTEFPAVEEAK